MLSCAEKALGMSVLFSCELVARVHTADHVKVQVNLALISIKNYPTDRNPRVSPGRWLEIIGDMVQSRSEWVVELWVWR